MNGDRHGSGFRLEITSLEDFLIFCAILRGNEDPEADAKIRALVTRLKTANDAQAETVAANTPAG